MSNKISHVSLRGSHPKFQIIFYQVIGVIEMNQHILLIFHIYSLCIKTAPIIITQSKIDDTIQLAFKCSKGIIHVLAGSCNYIILLLRTY